MAIVLKDMIVQSAVAFRPLLFDASLVSDCFSSEFKQTDSYSPAVKDKKAVLSQR